MVGVANVVNVTGINTITKTKSLLRLSQVPSFQKLKTPREPQLPKEAIEGLKLALAQCNRPPKLIQDAADQLYEKLFQRQFPVSKETFMATRKFIIKKMEKSGIEQIDPDVYGIKIGNAHKELINTKVAKALKKMNYSWKPLDFDTQEKAAAYALGLLSPYYSEVYRVLCEFDSNKFVPETILDFGSGVGGSFWACHQKFGQSVKDYTLVESNSVVSQVAMEIMRTDKEKGVFVHPNINFRRSLVPSLQTKYDLVIAHRALIEFPNIDIRLELIRSLWERTKKYLIFIESHMEDSFNAILEARDYILNEGRTVDYNQINEIFQNNGVFDYNVREVLNNNKISPYEKYSLLKSKLPKDVILPTSLEIGHVYAPCPHDKSCPKQDALNIKKGSCNFSVKYRDIRADGKKTRLRNGTGNTSFSYVILEKGDRVQGKEFNPRLVGFGQRNKHFNCHGCTSFHGIQHFVVSKKNKNIYQMTKGLNHGDKIPYKVEVERNLLDGEMLSDEEIFNLTDI